MFKTISGKKTIIKRTGSSVLAAALGLGVCLAPTAAFASQSADAPPTVIEITGNDLLIQLPGGLNYVAFSSGAPTGCFTVSIDTMKFWASQAQSALLAGKNLRIFYTDCGSPSTHAINAVDIQR